MKVILLNNIKKIGSRFDIIDVADGFAQNFLIPQKKALPATPENLGNIEGIKTERAELVAQEREETQAIIRSIDGITLSYAALANEQGGLYESITPATVAELLSQQANIRLEEMYIIMESPLKKIGEFEIPCTYEDVSARITLNVTAETPSK